jgi:tRNA pseudouridine65 synthase
MLKILFEDPYLIAIHKPAGLLVHRSELDRHETLFAVQLLREQTGRMVWPVHRLDRGTSGVLLFALDRDTLRRATQIFEDNAVEKTYLAVVRGWPEYHGIIDYPLSRQYDDYERQFTGDVGPAQDAITAFERLATVELPIEVDRYPTSRYALLRLYPRTGRRHQLRRHLKHIAHPIIGDATHGKGIHNRMFQQQFGCNRMLLLCQSMRLPHPVSGIDLCLETRIDDDFATLIERLGWSTRL